MPKDCRWIKANVNMTGFYRVHYDDNNWKALSDQLEHKHEVSIYRTFFLPSFKMLKWELGDRITCYLEQRNSPLSEANLVTNEQHTLVESRCYLS